VRCPACGECGFDGGRCTERVSRGRRFFLVGALALPVARKIEVVAGIVAPVADVFTLADVRSAVDILRANQVAPETLFKPSYVMAVQDSFLDFVFRDALFPNLVLRREMKFVQSSVQVPG